MTEIISAVYKGGVLTPLQDAGLREGQTVRLQVIPSRVRITARAAQRKVNRFLLDEISYLMGGEQPSLAETDRLVWRVPIVLTYPAHGIVGQVGSIDVDTESGELLLSPETVEEIQHNARALAAHIPPETTPSI
jgi:predicted DNA-binding antitoxin AbrB/MazE fold protein